MEVIKGHKYFINGDIVFPPGEQPVQNIYRTVLGPGVSHTGEIYRNSNWNVQFAVHRLTGVRFPDQPGRHEQYLVAQENFARQNIAVFQGLRRRYESYFDEYIHNVEEGALHYADTHPKKQLRVQAWGELGEAGLLGSDTDLWFKTAWWKLKTDEIAKPGKKPRMIVDLGVSASLRGFRLCEYLKIAVACEPLYMYGGKFEFCKSPNPHILQRIFEELYNPPGRFYFVYFSDDACFSVRHRGKVYWHNFDIKSCDASHGPGLFALLRAVVPKRLVGDMDMLIQQLRAPLRVKDLTPFSKRVVILKPKGPRMYSGSTLTTVGNGIGSLLYGMAVAQDIDDSRPLDFEASAAKAGYDITGCEPLEKFEDVQFLKHSPVRDSTGAWKPLLNLGVILRASGVCRGDCPGRGDLTLRAKKFQSGLLLGAYPYAHFDLLTVMKRAVDVGSYFESDEFSSKVDRDDTYPPYFAHNDDVFRRYRLTYSEYSELIDLFARAQPGDALASPAISKILYADYGLQCKYR